MALPLIPIILASLLGGGAAASKNIDLIPGVGPNEKKRKEHSDAINASMARNNVYSGEQLDFDPKTGRVYNTGIPYTGGDAGGAGATAVGNSSSSGGGGLLYGGGGAIDRDASLRNSLRGEIASRGGEIDSIYSTLFGNLDSLLRTRGQELESQYGEQFKKAADAYTGALPEIENSYAAIGAADSTDRTDAKTKAKTGYEETTKTIGKNKKADEAKLGQYGEEQRARFRADQESAKRNLARVNETDDVNALRGLRNDIESNISQAGVTRATLGSDGAARQQLSSLTQDNGRFQEATNALDSIIKSSMSGSVKEAAVKAIVDNAGLSEEDKKKVNMQYGNVYAEQAAL